MFENFTPSTIKAIKKYGLIAIGVVILLWFVIFLFTHSWVIVETGSDDATVRVYKNQEVILEKKGQSVHGIVGNGEYSVEVSVGDKQAIEHASLPRAWFKKLTVIPRDLKSKALVSNSYIDDIYVGNPSVVLGISDNERDHIIINSSGAAEGFYNYELFNHYSWSNNGIGAGIAASTGSEGAPVGVIKNGQFLNPEDEWLDPPYSTAVSSNGDIWFASQSSLYSLSSDYSSFSKITTLETDINVLAASDEMVVFAETHGGADADEAWFKVGVYSIESKTVKYIDEVFFPSEDMNYRMFVNISPDNQHIAITDMTNGSVYNHDLKRVKTLPTSSDISANAWVSDTELLYAAANKVWSLDMNSSVIHLLAASDANSLVRNLRYDPSSKTLYSLESNSKFYDAVYKISLETELKTDPVLDKLSEILPREDISNFCKTSFVALDKKSVVMFVLEQDTYEETEAAIAGCRQSVLELLTESGVDPNSVVLSSVTTEVMGDLDQTID